MGKNVDVGILRKMKFFTDSECFKCWSTKTGDKYYELCRMLALNWRENKYLYWLIFLAYFDVTNTVMTL